MSIEKRVALVASVVALATSPLAAGWPMKSGTSAAPLTESQMQANSSEAPAWHAGDRSVYDSSQGRIIAPPMLASNAPTSPPVTSNAPPPAESNQAAVPSDTTQVQPVPPTAGIASSRGTANPARYGYRPK